ncbi:MAG: SxtJ family membrane protein [bacterium]
METGVPARLSPAEGRRFAFVVGAAFLGLAVVFWWRAHAFSMRVAGALGVLLLLAGLLIPSRLGPVHRVWMGLAHAISKVTTPVFMGLLYFLVLTPVGIVRRTLGRDPLVRPAGPSYWIERDAAHRRSDLERQF